MGICNLPTIFCFFSDLPILSEALGHNVLSPQNSQKLPFWSVFVQKNCQKCKIFSAKCRKETFDHSIICKNDFKQTHNDLKQPQVAFKIFSELPGRYNFCRRNNGRMFAKNIACESSRRRGVRGLGGCTGSGWTQTFASVTPGGGGEEGLDWFLGRRRGLAENSHLAAPKAWNFYFGILDQNPLIFVYFWPSGSSDQPPGDGGGVRRA